MAIEFKEIGGGEGEGVNLKELMSFRMNLQGQAAYWALRDQVNHVSSHRENLVRYAMIDTQLSIIDRAIKKY